MNAVLFWKEYRQHRALWLTIFGLAALLLVSFSITLERREQDFAVIYVLRSLAVAYGVIAGASLLAGEKEDGTLDFLDRLAGRRGPVWLRKFVAGASMALSQSLALAALALALGYGSFDNLLTMLGIGIYALAWGLLAGALYRNVLKATLLGIAIMAGCCLLLFVGLPGIVAVPIVTGNFVLGLGAFYVSWRSFCRDDRSRQPPRVRPIRRLIETVPASWRAVIWLCCRQGRWALATVGTSAVLLGILELEVVFWPIGSLLLGLICGLAVFSRDQDGGRQFVAPQRIPFGRYWTAKTTFWLAILACAIGLSLYEATKMTQLLSGHNLDKPGTLSDWVGAFTDWHYPKGSCEPVLLLIIWPLYGFCVGHFLGMAMRRPVIAAFLSLVFAPLIAAWWAPSLIVGGVHAWWIFVVPLSMLLTSLLATRPWLAGRLLTVRPMLGIAAAITLMGVFTAAFLWHRATELPDTGEPFDVKEYISSLPSPEHNQANRLIRDALAKLKQRRTEVDGKLDWPIDPNSPATPVREKDSLRIAVDRAYDTILNDVLKEGWPAQDKKVGVWLDELFEGKWAAEIQKITELPLGTFKDPSSVSSRYSVVEQADDCRKMARLLIGRGLQLQARGDKAGALNWLETALAISRQLQNNAVYEQFEKAEEIEKDTLAGYRRWLEQLGPNKELLRVGLEVLQRHEAAKPSLANNIKAEYLVARGDRYFFREDYFIRDVDRNDENSRSRGAAHWLRILARQVPWENQRESRLLNAFFAEQLLQIREGIAWSGKRNRSSDSATGSGAALDDLLDSFEHERLYLYLMVGGLRRDFAYSERRVHAVEIATAIGCYYADHKKLPAQLDDLAPAYLANVPIDPVSGRPFTYRISAGERIDPADGVPLVLAPGQAIIIGEDSVSSKTLYVPAPTWAE